MLKLELELDGVFKFDAVLLICCAVCLTVCCTVACAALANPDNLAPTLLDEVTGLGG